MSLEDIKTLLEIEDSSKDKQLNLIMDNVTKQLLEKLGGLKEVPEELSYIVTEVSVIRFNRIGSEGMTSHSVEGNSTSYSTDDFEAYKDDIQAFLDRTDISDIGKVKFL